MARKLGPDEYLERHLKEAEEVLSLFKKNKELQYRDIRQRLFLDKKSLLKRKREKENGSKVAIIAHETQLTRILNALCIEEVLKKNVKGNNTYYILNLSEKGLEEIGFKCSALSDPSFFKDFIEKMTESEKQIEGYKNRIYELNIEIGRHIRENIELKEQLAGR